MRLAMDNIVHIRVYYYIIHGLVNNYKAEASERLDIHACETLSSGLQEMVSESHCL